jgi:hypothetical protein
MIACHHGHSVVKEIAMNSFETSPQPTAEPSLWRRFMRCCIDPQSPWGSCILPGFSALIFAVFYHIAVKALPSIAAPLSDIFMAIFSSAIVFLAVAIKYLHDSNTLMKQVIASNAIFTDGAYMAFEAAKKWGDVIFSYTTDLKDIHANWSTMMSKATTSCSVSLMKPEAWTDALQRTVIGLAAKQLADRHVRFFVIEDMTHADGVEIRKSACDIKDLLDSFSEAIAAHVIPKDTAWGVTPYVVLQSQYIDILNAMNKRFPDFSTTVLTPAFAGNLIAMNVVDTQSCAPIALMWNIDRTTHAPIGAIPVMRPSQIEPIRTTVDALMRIAAKITVVRSEDVHCTHRFHVTVPNGDPITVNDVIFFGGFTPAASSKTNMPAMVKSVQMPPDSTPVVISGVTEQT